MAAFGQDSARTSARSGGAAGWSVSFGTGPMAGPAVTGAPYSAEEVTERVQTLADGTHITQPSPTLKIYRDSEGRTRTEHSLLARAANGQPGRTEAPAVITIIDPVANVMYTLTTTDKVARKLNLQAPESVRAPQPGVPGGSSAFAHVGPPPGPSHETPEAALPKTTQEKLGSQTIEGLPVEGTRSSTTWPIGSRGNDRPITAVNETWRSPDLGVVVLSKDNDPISGDSTRKLINITRGEPDPSLFQPPADYTVVTQETGRSSH
jgi:hypothetical protein